MAKGRGRARLDLKALAKGCPALTPAQGAGFSEAASVCLAHNAHAPGVSMALTGKYSERFSTAWLPITEQMQRGHADLQDATRDGATGVAILVVKRKARLTAVERSRTGTGFDYWMGRSANALFQNMSRLEVSGILNARGPSVVKARARQKENQTKRSDSTGLTAHVVVVDFGKPSVHYTVRK